MDEDYHVVIENANEQPLFVNWVRRELRRSKKLLINMRYDRETVRATLASYKKVHFMFIAKTRLHHERCVDELLNYITGHAPGGLALYVGFVEVWRGSDKLSSLLVSSEFTFRNVMNTIRRDV